MLRNQFAGLHLDNLTLANKCSMSSEAGIAQPKVKRHHLLSVLRMKPHCVFTQTTTGRSNENQTRRFYAVARSRGFSIRCAI